jgi:hypothetical protein
MRRVREVLRLRTAVVGLNEIARRLSVAPSTVRLTLQRLASVTFDIASEGGPHPFELRRSTFEMAGSTSSGRASSSYRQVVPA